LNTLIHPFDEIRGYIAHNDLSLAVRRLLDISLDSGKETLLQQAIQLSRFYRNFSPDATEIPEVNTRALALLAQLEEEEPADYRRQALMIAENISKTYTASRFSLNALSLQIGSGDILGVVGENGNGKTTLLRCLSGQLAIDSGTISYPQLKKADYYAIKHHIAFIPQRIPRWYGQLKDNLHFSAAISGIVGRQNELMVDFMLERLNLAPYALLTWEQISSGYRTRFEIARILLQRPSLLILDEPLANLDINAQQTILTDLRYMAKSAYQPMGVILSSQQLHEVEKVADTVLFIKNGACLFRTDDTNTQSSFVAELETTATRQEILAALGEGVVKVSFNGGFYTLETNNISTAEMLKLLVAGNIPVTYFRDITHSTKRFF